MATRRNFLGTLVAAAAVPRLSWADAGNPAFVAAAKDPDGSYALYGLSDSGEDRFRVPLPARGHAAAAHPDRPEAVAFARRPGTYALVLDCTNGSVISRLTAPDGHTFNGHGAFSLGGDRLYTSEVVASTGEGRIGVWSGSKGYKRTGDFPSHGIGPHEIRRLPASETLVVANGGIRTEAGGREKLNLDTMAPNLAYLDPDGGVLDLIELPKDQRLASIRHLSVDAGGLVAFAMQWQGEVAQAPALLGLHRKGQGGPLLGRAPDGVHQAMKGYAGSVTFFEQGSRIAISSPKGGRVQVFRKDGSFAYEVARPDVCGLAATQDALVLMDGLGVFAVVRQGRIRSHRRARRAWDNHLVKL